MPSQTETQRQKWQTSEARYRWAESLLRRAQNQITIESDAVAKIQTAINAAQTEVAAILVDIQANQAPEWRVRRAQQQVAALERLDGELRSKLLTIARAATEEVKILSKGMPQQEADKISKEVGKAVSKLTKSTNSARPEIGRSAEQGRGLVAIDARSVDIASSFVPELIADQVGTLKKAVQAEIIRNSLALTTPAESIARLTSVATPIGAFPTAAVRAEAIVRTEFGRVSNIAAMSGIQALAANPYGLSRDQRSYMLDVNGVMYKEWIAVGDHRTRPEHAALDGTIIPINESFMVGEYTAQFPKDPSLPAKHAVNCRCMVVPSFPPEIADRLGAMPDAGDGSFGDMLAMMQEGGMVGTATGGGGGEAFSYPPENPPNGFDYDIGYDPSDAMMNTFSVEQSGTTPALSGATDQTAPQQPITVIRSVSPLMVISGIQQQFNLSGTVRTATSRPSSLLAFVQFATKILNTVERKALLKPIASKATHDPRISVDADEFQVWLAQERGEVGRKKPLKNKKKVVVDNDEIKAVELPTPLLVATAESIAKLSAEELAFLVGSSSSDRMIQRRYWELVLETDQGAYGVDPNNDLSLAYGRGAKLTFDRKKWLALPQPVRATIIRGLLVGETVSVGRRTADLVTAIVEDLGSVVELRQDELKAKNSWDNSSGLLRNLLELLNEDAQAAGIGRTPSDQTITLRIGTPDEGQGSGYTSLNPMRPELNGTEFEKFARFIALDDLTLRVADLHKTVILKIKVPTDPAERERYFQDMKADGSINMGRVDIAAGTLTLGVSGYDFVMNYFVRNSAINDPSGMQTSDAVLGDIFTLPARGSISATGDSLNHDVWYADSDGQLVLDLSKFISFGGAGDKAREFILAHNKATGESIVGAGRHQEMYDLDDGSGRKVFQMHDLVDPPSPQVILPADGRIVGVENIFNFLYNKTGVYDTALLKTHYAIGGWRLATERPVPILVLPAVINSREIAVPILSHLEKLLAYQVKMGTGGVNRDNLMPFKKKFGTYAPSDNFFLNLMGELIEKGRVAVPNAQSEDPLIQWETPPTSIVAVEAALPELILIANKKRRGENLTDEEKAAYENATTRLGNLRDALDLAVDWATGFYDQDNSQGTAIEVLALRKKLTSLGLDLNEDFALWRAAKLQDTVFGELANKIIAATKEIPRSLLLRRMFGIRGLAGGGIKNAESGGWNRSLDPFDENNGADALDLVQFAEERGVTPEQILGEQRVSMLRKLYEADLLEVEPSTRSSMNGLRDGVGAGAVTISLETSGVAVSAAKKVKILVPARLGEEGVTYDQLKRVSDNIEIPAEMDFYDQNAAMGSGALAIQDTSLPFRAHSVLTIEGEDGFRMILRIAAGNQLLGLANTGLFKSVNFRSASTSTEPRGGRGQLAVTSDANNSNLAKLGVLTMAAELARDAKKTALTLADSIARDALNDPLQFEDVLRAVARAAVERGASPDDPLIAAFLALPRLQDAAEITAPQMWDDPREFGYKRLRMKRNPELEENPHYVKATQNLAGSRRQDPMDMVDMSAIVEALYPRPVQPPAGSTPEVMAEYYVAKTKAAEAQSDWVNRIRRDPTFILRAILSRAYTKEQQRALMGTVAPHEGQLLIKEQAWDKKPVDVSWYELEATLLEIIADEAAKHMPAGKSDGTLVSEDAYGTIKMTPELWEATQLLDAYNWDAAKGGDDVLAAYDMVLTAARNNAEQRQTIIKARITPLVEALGYQRGTPEFENLVDVFVTHAQVEFNRLSTILGNGENRDYFLPAGLAALNSKLVKFGKRGLSDIVADGAGMAVGARFRRYARLRSPDGDYEEKSPFTPQKLRLVAKAVRDHIVNLQLELKSLSRKQIIDALNENNAALLGGRIKAAEWQAKARKLIRKKRSEIEAERRRLQKAAKGKPAVQVSDALYEKTLEALDKDLEAAIKIIPKTKFLEVTDNAVQREIEQYRERIDDLMKGVEKTIMGVTTVELDTPDTAKSIGSGSINKPWKGKWKGHPFIIKSIGTMYDQTIREDFGDFKYSDLWAEPAAQIIDELGGLFIRKAQAYRRDLPDIKDSASGKTLRENEALVMDWLTGYDTGHGARKRGQKPTNEDLMGLFDALIGNTDRHGGNYLLAPIPTARQPLFDDDGDPIDPVTKQKTGENWDEYKIVPIDNGLAFPDPEVHLDQGWANLSPFMPYSRGEMLTPRSREVLLRLWSNRSELYVRLTSQMGAGRTRGFFYRLIWMLRSNELMDRDTFSSAAYNPMSSNADEIIRGAFEDGQSLLDALVTPVSSQTTVRQDPNRIEGQIPALPLSDEP